MIGRFAAQSFGAALLYAVGFFGSEALLCLTAEFGCQTRGDIAAVIVVGTVFTLIAALVLGAYLVTLQRLGAQILTKPIVAFLCSFCYGIMIALLFFGIVGQLGSFFSHQGFWIHSSIGSACFAAFVAFLLAKKAKALPT